MEKRKRMADKQTTVQVTRDDMNLYIAFKCNEPAPTAIAFEPTR